MSEKTSCDKDKPLVRTEPAVCVYNSFEEENAAEHRRLAAMSHRERMQEFSVLQARRWGKDWGRSRIEKRATWERLSW